MKIKTVSSDLQNMSQSGDAILKSLQNNSFSLADIIVRNPFKILLMRLSLGLSKRMLILSWEILMLEN